MKIAIAAASGNIGRRTAEKVIQSGAETILLTRQPEKLADTADRGATVKSISSDDTQGLIEATRDADALFWLTPPKLDTPSLRNWYIQTAITGATSDVQQELGNLFYALGDRNGIYATARTPEAITPTRFEEFVKHKLLSKIR